MEAHDFMAGSEGGCKRGKDLVLGRSRRHDSLFMFIFNYYGSITLSMLGMEEAGTGDGYWRYGSHRSSYEWVVCLNRKTQVEDDMLIEEFSFLYLL